MKSRPFDKTRETVAIAALLTFCLILAPFAAAQEEPCKEATEKYGKGRTVIKQTAYTDVRDLAELLGLLDVAVRIDVEHQAIVLRGHDSELDTAIKLIEALDEPPAPSLSIELTVFIVGASKEKSDAAALPSDLEAVVARLGDLFGYRDFELLDTIFLRVRDGSGAQVESFLNEENPYQFRFKRARIFGFNRTTMQEDESILRFEDLFFHHLKESTDLQTGVEIREGQKAVIGKTTPGRDGQTLILVLEAKILEYYDE